MLSTAYTQSQLLHSCLEKCTVVWEWECVCIASCIQYCKRILATFIRKRAPTTKCHLKSNIGNIEYIICYSIMLYSEAADISYIKWHRYKISFVICMFSHFLQHCQLMFLSMQCNASSPYFVLIKKTADFSNGLYLFFEKKFTLFPIVDKKRYVLFQ